jgi:hypothetical protein
MERNLIITIIVLWLLAMVGFIRIAKKHDMWYANDASIFEVALTWVLMLFWPVLLVLTLVKDQFETAKKEK